jgi:hypothetical protein
MKNNNTMKMDTKIKDIIDMLEEALSFEDWRKVENAQKELTFLYEELESSFPLDEWEDEDDLN